MPLPDAPALYLTTLSEPLDKFIQHGQTYDFFDSARVGETVFYEDLGAMVTGARDRRAGRNRHRNAGATQAEPDRHRLIQGAERTYRNSIRAAHDTLRPGQRSHRLPMHHVSDWRIFRRNDDRPPEFAIADSILLLMKQSTGVREQRFLRVEKLRGSASIPGHARFQYF